MTDNERVAAIRKLAYAAHGPDPKAEQEADDLFSAITSEEARNEARGYLEMLAMGLLLPKQGAKAGKSLTFDREANT